MRTKSVFLLVMVVVVVGCGVAKTEVVQPTLPQVVLAVGTKTYEPTPTPVVVTPTVGSTAAYSIFGDSSTLIPTSLDEAWAFVDQGQPGWTFPQCLPGEVVGENITWDMAKRTVKAETKERHDPFLEIKASEVARIVGETGGTFPNEGFVHVSEQEVFVELIGFLTQGEMKVCSVTQDGRNPTVYGDGVQKFLIWLQKYIIYNIYLRK